MPIYNAYGRIVAHHIYVANAQQMACTYVQGLCVAWPIIDGVAHRPYIRP